MRSSTEAQYHNEGKIPCFKILDPIQIDFNFKSVTVIICGFNSENFENRKSERKERLFADSF